MKQLALEVVKRGQSVRTTLSNPQDEKPLDLVDRQFVASRPNHLWVADITYVAKWSGMVYVAFVTDVFSRYIVAWRVLKTMKTYLLLDALEQASWARGKSGQIRGQLDPLL